MTNQSSYVGLLYSRDLEFANFKVHGTLFHLKTLDRLSFDDIPLSVQKKTSTKLRSLEKKHKNIVECIIIFDKTKANIDIIFSRAAKIRRQNYLDVMKKLVEQRVLSIQDVIKKIPLNYISSWIAPCIDPAPKPDLVIYHGNALTYGVGRGVLLYGLSSIKKSLKEGKKVIMLAAKLKQEDLEIFGSLSGIILTKSGPTSHAAVIAKGLGIPCILVDGGSNFSQYVGSEVTLDADRGILYKGFLPVKTQPQPKFFNKLMKEAVGYSKLGIASNADTRKDALLANSYFAQGVGLCRTEHMFLNKDGRSLVRKILFSKTITKKEQAIFTEKQKNDFYDLFLTQAGKYVVVRLLDAPLNEFMKNSSKDSVLHEENPMLGFRGARFLLQKPEVMRMQVEAVCQAVNLLHEENKNIQIKFEIPMVMDIVEIEIFRNIVEEEVSKIQFRRKFDYKIGTMIEIPRTAYLIKEIASKVDFISFGTNDLTQMFCGLSRDDSERFLGFYQKKGVFADNPFISLDEKGVGAFVAETSKKAFLTNPDIEISICGEQAAHPASIQFLLKTHINTISCSASRLPIALFASAKYSLN